jgi:RNA polymerase sigma-70 factor (ECF subfamily)
MSRVGSSDVALSMAACDDATRVAELYREHRDRVYRIALRYAGGDGAWAEDVTQDVFVSLCRTLHRLDDDGDMQGWFYRVTQNACLSRLRRRAMMNAPGVRWLLGRRAHEIVDLEETAAHRQGVRRVLGVLDTLGPKERVAFCMYHLDGLEQAEIGAILGFTKSYVCKLIKRAESRLKEDGCTARG